MYYGSEAYYNINNTTLDKSELKIAIKVFSILTSKGVSDNEALQFIAETLIGGYTDTVIIEDFKCVGMWL